MQCSHYSHVLVCMKVGCDDSIQGYINSYDIERIVMGMCLQGRLCGWENPAKSISKQTNHKRLNDLSAL